MYIAVLSLLLLSSSVFIGNSMQSMHTYTPPGTPARIRSPLKYEFHADVSATGNSRFFRPRAGPARCHLNDNTKIVRIIMKDLDPATQFDLSVDLHGKTVSPLDGDGGEPTSFSIRDNGFEGDFFVFGNVEMIDARVSVGDLIKQLRGKKLEFKATVVRDGWSGIFSARVQGFKNVCEVDSATMKMTISTPSTDPLTGSLHSVCIDLTTSDIKIQHESGEGNEHFRIGPVHERKQSEGGDLSDETSTYDFRNVELIPNFHKCYETFDDVADLFTTLRRWVQSVHGDKCVFHSIPSNQRPLEVRKRKQRDGDDLIHPNM